MHDAYLYERLLKRTDRGFGDTCWRWRGAVRSGGYGAIKCADGKRIGAHRAMWTALHGPIPDTLFVLHRCDNPRCVNPAHLFLGTHQDNVDDKVAKGRDQPWNAKRRRFGRRFHEIAFTPVDEWQEACSFEPAELSGM